MTLSRRALMIGATATTLVPASSPSLSSAITAWGNAAAVQSLLRANPKLTGRRVAFAVQP